jgi:hydrogenase maturation factor
VDSERGLALCADETGEHHTVEIALVDAGLGDEVLVHAGVALVTL